MAYQVILPRRTRTPGLSPGVSMMVCMETPRPPNRHLLLAVVLAGVFMAVLDGVVVSIALPTITARFGVDLDTTQWIITAYLLTMTVLLLPAGRLADFIGRTPLFISGLVLFTLASGACGLAPSLPFLVAARMVQATGGAMVFSLSNALIIDAFPFAERARALGYLGSTVAIASIAAPVLGGLLVETYGWESVFFVNLPIGVVVVTGALRILPRDHTRPDLPSFDLPGAVTLGIALSGLMLCLGHLADSTTFDLVSILYALIAVAGTVAFVQVERRRPDPLVDLSLLGEPLYILPVGAMLLFFVASFMLNLVGPFYFELVMGLSPGTVGLVFLVLPSAMAVTAPVSGWLYDRTHYPYLAALGMGLVAIGYIAAGIAAIEGLLFPILGAFVLIGFGAALFQSPNNTDQMNAVTSRRLGLASAVTAAGRNLGMSLGVSIGSILLSVLLLAGGHSGPVLEAEPTLVAGAIGVIFFTGAGLATFSTLLSAIRGRRASAAASPHR